MESLDFDGELTGDLGVTTALERACTLHDKVRLAMDRLKPMPGSRIPKRMENDREALALLRDKLEVLEDQLRECRLLEPNESEQRNTILCQLDSTRRDIIAACREGQKVVVSCQELCKEVLSFCELTPQETITPRSMPASWRVASSVAASRYGAVAPASTEGTITSAPPTLSIITEASSGPQQWQHHQQQQHQQRHGSAARRSAAADTSKRGQELGGASGSGAFARGNTDLLPSSLSTWRQSRLPSPKHVRELSTVSAAIREASAPEAAVPPTHALYTTTQRPRAHQRADQTAPRSRAAQDVPDYGGKVSVRQYANIESDSEGPGFAARDSGHHMSLVREDYLPRLRNYGATAGDAGAYDAGPPARDTTNKQTHSSKYISPAQMKAAVTQRASASGLPTISEPYHQRPNWLQRLAVRLLKLTGSLAATAVLATAAAITVSMAVDEISDHLSSNRHEVDSEEVLLEPFPLPATAPGPVVVTQPSEPRQHQSQPPQQQQRQQHSVPPTVWGFPLQTPQLQFPGAPQQSQPQQRQQQQQQQPEGVGKGRRKKVQKAQHAEAELEAQQRWRQQQQQQEQKLKQKLTLMMPFGPMMPHPDVTAGQG